MFEPNLISFLTFVILQGYNIQTELDESEIKDHLLFFPRLQLIDTCDEHTL